MKRCPATRTGKKLSGMKTTDALTELDSSKHWEVQKAVVSCALAEILEGYFTCLGGDIGFYFVTKKDVSHFIYFSEIISKIQDYTSDPNVINTIILLLEHVRKNNG